MEMTDREVCLRFRRSGKRKSQINILAELNAVPASEIRTILIEGGELQEENTGKEVPKQEPKEVQKPIPERIIQVLLERIDVLDQELSAIEKEKKAKEEEYLQIMEFIKNYRAG